MHFDTLICIGVRVYDKGKQLKQLLDCSFIITLSERNTYNCVWSDFIVRRDVKDTWY